MMKTLARCTLSLTLLSPAIASADDPSSTSGTMATCPMHAQHMAAAGSRTARADGSAEHGRHVDGRHDTFGMSHTTSTHSFRLFADGGVIELRATRATDEATVAAIRTHLQEITPQFRKGDFSTPRFVHGTAPDGVGRLEELGKDITYKFERFDDGGRIRITTRSRAAREAVHDFLRFQVIEHRTANSGKVEADGRAK